MSDIEQKIQGAVHRNRELLATLGETDYAPSALEQQRKYIGDIKHELNQLGSHIKQLEIKRQKELKDHEKYRDSVMKRFAYRVGRKTDKFEAKAEKEEREYFDVLHEEHQAKEHQKELQSNLEEAEKQSSNLESVVAQRKQAQTELNALYDSIFEGPTPGFPEEDEKERVAEQVLQSYHNLSTQLESETCAIGLLDQAKARMAAAVAAMADARSHSQMDMFGGGMMWDMMERNALSKAESLSTAAQFLIAQAQRMSPHVGPVYKASVAQGNLMSDVMFDNPFTDHVFHQKIKASQDEMHQSAQMLQGEWMRCRDRINGMRGQLQDESKKLEAARVDLQTARGQAFEKVASSGPA